MSNLDKLYKEAIRHKSVNVDDMDPMSHAYHEEASPRSDRDHWGVDDYGDPVQVSRDPSPRFLNPTPWDVSDEEELANELVRRDDESGYNWGPEPDYDSGSEPGIDPNFVDDRPLPFGTPIYNPQRPNYES